MSSRAPESVPAGIARLGFADPRRAAGLLDDPVLEGLAGDPHRIEAGGLSEALSRTADPDAALLGLVRVLEAVGEAGLREEGVSALTDDPVARAPPPPRVRAPRAPPPPPLSPPPP